MVDLPEPLSPTMARVWPARIVRNRRHRRHARAAEAVEEAGRDGEAHGQVGNAHDGFAAGLRVNAHGLAGIEMRDSAQQMLRIVVTWMIETPGSGRPARPRRHSASP